MKKIVLSLKLTQKCSFKCLHCLRHKPSKAKDLPFYYFQKIMKEAMDLNPNQMYIILNGGEPTLYPYFRQIVSFFLEHNIHWRIVTNGWDFNSIFTPILRQNKNLLNLMHPIFSLDGISKTHDIIRARGSFNRIVNAIRLCRQYSVPFTIQTSLNILNICELEKIAKFASKNKAYSWNILMTTPTPKTVEKKLLPNISIHRSILKKISDLSLKYRPLKIAAGPNFFINNPFILCRQLFDEVLHIDTNGRFVFCCHLSEYAGSKSLDDVFGSVDQMDIAEACRKFQKKILDFKKNKIMRIAKGEFSFLEHVPCYYCFTYFKKFKILDENCADRHISFL